MSKRPTIADAEMLLAEMIAAARAAGMVKAISGEDGVRVDGNGKVYLYRPDKCGCALGAIALCKGVSPRSSGRWAVQQDLGSEFGVNTPEWSNPNNFYHGNDRVCNGISEKLLSGITGLDYDIGSCFAQEMT